MSTQTRWSRWRYTPGLALYKGRPRVTDSAEHQALSEEAAGEGIVILKNDGTLPFAGGTRVALFGKATFDYVRGGGGSGDVTVSSTLDLYDAIKDLPGQPLTVSDATIPFYREYVKKQYEEGLQPGCIAEPALPAAFLKQAAAEAEVAVLSISRYSGEGWDRKLDNKPKGEYSDFTKAEHQYCGLFYRGDFYLSAAEEKLVAQLKKAFKTIVVLLNVGGIVDSAWFTGEDRIRAALLTGQGGMRGQAAVAKALAGLISPSGRLIDTWAENIADYPSTAGFFDSDDYVAYEEDIYVGYRYFSTIPGAADKVIYPFGYGLSYTDFELDELGAVEEDGIIEAMVTVVNTGSRPGREVMQLYVEAPQGKLGKPARVLVAFGKTRLLQPGESQRLTLKVPVESLASYDDLGKIRKAAWVLEKGEYRFHLGWNAEATVELSYSLTIPRDRVVRQVVTRIAPKALTRRLTASGKYEKLPAVKDTARKKKDGLPALPQESWDGTLPGARAVSPVQVINPAKNMDLMMEVAEGKRTLRSLIAELTDEDLCWLFSGTPNTGIANTCGMGNLPAVGIPSIMTADGPAGFRTLPGTGVTATAWPVASTLAATWDEELLTRVGAAVAEEVLENNVAIWLAPGMNIHRSPLCGRNFEYFSEDPLLTGRMAAAVVRGVQSRHIAATLKHFACNNKETNRRESDSRVSERAAREIYLKGFEIAVKESDPWCIMTSYNIINGTHASENEELLMGILREEWGFKGLVMTDWWSTGDPYRDLLGGIDVRMPNGVPQRIRQALDKGLISRSDLERATTHLLELILKLD